MKHIFFLLSVVACFAGIEDHYKKIEYKFGSLGPKNIDYVYLINLDQRPERFANTLKLLAPYDIIPERFSAIYGWTIPPKVLSDIALKFQHGMWTGHEYIMHFPPDGDGNYQFIWLDGSCYGKNCFSGWTVKGTIGCSLSHLSVLKDAYDSGYETIWILEDDISIKEDPHQLSDLIEELDSLVGSDGWDVLYTDRDYFAEDPSKPLREQMPYMWRPDMPSLDLRILTKIQDIGDHFLKIGTRMRAHSMIYRRCGIKKILDFYRAHNNFLPYDHEVSLVPGIKLFVTKKSIVSVNEQYSDTRHRHF